MTKANAMRNELQLVQDHCQIMTRQTGQFTPHWIAQAVQTIIITAAV